ncbi:MAG: SWF or SNF family helicase, partial [Actinocrinis sp.]
DPGAAGAPMQRRTPVGTPARDAFAGWQPPRDPGLVDDRVAQAASPIVLGASALAAGFDPPSLEMLAAGASVHAKTLLDAYLDDTSADDAQLPALVPDLDAHRDAVRLLSGEHRDVHVFARLVEGLGVEPARVARGILAWRYAGAAGFDVLEEPWTPPAAELTRSRTLLRAGWDEETAPEPATWRNRWTFAEQNIQLRYGRDGRWHPYRRRDGAWWPDGPPGHDPADVLAALL